MPNPNGKKRLIWIRLSVYLLAGVWIFYAIMLIGLGGLGVYASTMMGEIAVPVLVIALISGMVAICRREVGLSFGGIPPALAALTLLILLV